MHWSICALQKNSSLTNRIETCFENTEYSWFCFMSLSNFKAITSLSKISKKRKVTVMTRKTIKEKEILFGLVLTGATTGAK